MSDGAPQTAERRRRYELEDTGFDEVPKKYRKYYRKWGGPDDPLAPNEALCPVCKVVIRSARELREGDRLYCMCCFARLQVVQGEHILVTETTCFLCHMKESEEVDFTSNEKLGNCTTCHNWDVIPAEHMEDFRFDHTPVVDISADEVPLPVFASLSPSAKKTLRAVGSPAMTSGSMASICSGSVSSAGTAASRSTRSGMR